MISSFKSWGGLFSTQFDRSMKNMSFFSSFIILSARSSKLRVGRVMLRRRINLILPLLPRPDQPDNDKARRFAPAGFSCDERGRQLRLSSLLRPAACQSFG